MPPKLIIVVGPNPAHQKTLVFSSLTIDKVNRALSSREYTGGKGTNFCRASRCLETLPSHCRTILFTFTGGWTGSRVLELFAEEGIHVHSIPVTANTRSCITCLDTAAGTMTELIEPSCAVSPDEADAMDAAVLSQLGSAAGLAVMGSLPDGTDPDLYTRWVRLALGARVPVLIDAVKGIEPALRLPGAHVIFKVNMEELFKVTGKDNVTAAFDYAMEEWSVSVLAVTDGPNTAYLQVRGAGPRRQYHMAPLQDIVSPLGAGDTADAVFFSLYLSGMDPFEAFRLALAAASANCLQQDSGVFTIEDMDQIAPTIVMANV